MELFGIPLLDTYHFTELIIRFMINTLVMIVLVRYLYYKQTNRKDYLFTYFLIATTVFLICFMLENVKLELGFALGLFAVFGIIRYRTQQIEIKEMTYLFIVIGISVINALSNRKISYAEIIFTNLALITITYLFERVFFLRHETRKNIDYEKIELIKPQNYQLMLDDLEERTGLKINRAEVGRINFLRDSARVRIYYYSEDNPMNFEDSDNGQYDDDDDD
jgi:cytochrome c biogenesis factor